MIFFIFNIIFLICILFFYYKSRQILGEEKQKLQEQQKAFQKYLNKELTAQQGINKEYLNRQQKLEKDLEQWQEKRKKEIETYLENQKLLIEQKIQLASKDADNQIEEVYKKVDNAKKEEKEIQNELNQLKSSLSAGVEARLREKWQKKSLIFINFMLIKLIYQILKS